MTQTTKKKKRRMRLPNGIGSVHKIGDGKSRRRPWRARVPSHIEFNAESGKATQKYIVIGYFETEQEAIAALFDYRKDPYSLEAATATFADVFELWSAKKYPEISQSGRYGYNAAFKNSAPLHDIKMRDLRTIHLEKVMAEVKGGYELQVRLKTFWGQLFKYAMEHDICQKNYAEFIKTRDKDQGTKRTAIPAEHREKLWQLADEGDEVAEVALILIYTGMRASELLETQKANVDLEARILIGGKKTDAGRDRHIPIHRCIVPLIEKRMQQPGETLITRTDKGKPQPITYHHFANYRWLPLMERMGWDYTMHYGRHTLATMMREADIAEDIRKLILGHKTADITDRYTHVSDAMLVEAIDKLPGREG